MARDGGRRLVPTYVYECPRCGEFEVVQSIKDAPLATCPNWKEAIDPNPGIYCGTAGRAGQTYMRPCGEQVRRLFRPSAAMVMIPVNMMAGSERTQARQAAYLESEKHREDMEKSERMQDRQSAFEQRKES